MVQSDRLKRIFGLALPIMGGMMSQNILNLIDTAMVGSLGNAALAAVGIGGFAAFMFQALILGVSTGVQATAARRKGAGKLDQAAVPLNAGLLLILCVAPLLSLALYFVVPYLYPYLNSDPQVQAGGEPYLQWRVLAITFMGWNFAYRGYWNAMDMTRYYMGTLVIMHSANVVLNYIFIFGHFGAPAMGAAGAGLATALATVIGSAIYFYLGLRHARDHGFLHGLPPRKEVAAILRLSLPNGIQQLFFATGFLTLYWIIGQIGTAELAAANVLINVMLVAILPGMGLGLAAATLVGQALGRRNQHDARRWGWDVTRVGIVLLAALGLPMWLTPDWILWGFIHDPGTLELARLPMRLVGLTMAIEAIGLILMHALLGAGDAKRVMLVSIGMQWLLFLPLAYLIGPVLGFGLLAIWLLQSGYRLLQSLILAMMWRKGQWASIEV